MFYINHKILPFLLCGTIKQNNGIE